MNKEEYAGRNLFLIDIVEDWMFTANQTGYIDNIPAIRAVDNIFIDWEAYDNYFRSTPQEARNRTN